MIQDQGPMVFSTSTMGSTRLPMPTMRDICYKTFFVVIEKLQCFTFASILTCGLYYKHAMIVNDDSTL